MNNTHEKAKMPTYIVGHKNPDTDSVAAAIAYADLKNKLGIPAVPVIAGDVNKGTELVLKKFKIKKPLSMDFRKIPEASVILVDHNEEGQRADHLIKEHVVEVIDHHRFADFSSAEPIYIRVHPWGSTSSIIAKMYRECGHVPEQQTASLMLSAILTDTLLFRSPTTSENDKEMAEWLNEIARIDMEEHANSIFKAKSDITHLTALDVISRDCKVFNFNEHVKMAVAVFETIDMEPSLARLDEFLTEIKEEKKKQKLNHFVFAIVDIKSQVAYFVAADDEDSQLIQHIFRTREQDGLLIVPGVVSRKKQMIPTLEEHFAGLDHKQETGER